MKHKNHHLHFFHYVFLLVILSTGLLTLNFLAFDRTLQIISVIATAAAYFAWGIIHHLTEKSLHPRVIAEYLLLAIIGSTILITVISQT